MLDFAGLKNKDIVGTKVWDAPWCPKNDNIKEQIRSAVSNAAAGNATRFQSEHISPDQKTLTVDVAIMLARALNYKPRRLARALIAEDDPAAQEVMIDIP